jgi:prepilin-type N-terminal cleavage/methylation domain-containing protein
MNMLKKGNQKGFTLIEIIAVLVILGILAAVAIPKYLSMADEARIKAAQGAIAEIKGRLASAQAKYMMANGGNAPTSPTLFTYATGANGYTSAANLANVGADFAATVTTGTPIAISVTSVGGVALATPVAGTFTAAGD